MAVWNRTYEAAFLIKSTPFMAMKNLGVKLDVYDLHFGTMPDVYAFRRTDEAKAKREALPKPTQEMHGDGTLQELSMKWFGAGFTDPSGLDKAMKKSVQQG